MSSFDNFEHLDQWHKSAARQEMLAELARLDIVEPDPEYNVQTGWTSFFTQQTAEPVAAPKYRTLAIILLVVWAFTVVMSFENKSGSLRSVLPRIRDAVDVANHPERIPLLVLLNNLTIIPVAFFFLRESVLLPLSACPTPSDASGLVAPCSSAWAVPAVMPYFSFWLLRPRPQYPKGRLSRYLHRVLVGE